MSLINCPKCNKEISNQVNFCPNCGCLLSISSKVHKKTRIPTSVGLIIIIAITWMVYEGSYFLNSNKNQKIEYEQNKIENTNKTNTTLTDAVKTEKILAELKHIPISKFEDNLRLYNILLKMHPDNEKYQNKVAFYKEKIKERDLPRKSNPTSIPNLNTKDEFKNKPTPHDDVNLTDKHKKELTLFGLKAMGFKGGIEGVKKILTLDEIKELVSTGLNLNGLLCAKIIEIHPLKLEGKFEIICIAYRGGSATKNYIIDVSKGTAFEQ